MSGSSRKEQAKDVEAVLRGEIKCIACGAYLAPKKLARKKDNLTSIDGDMCHRCWATADVEIVVL